MRSAKLSVAALGFFSLVAYSTEMDPLFQIRVDSAVYSPKAFIAKGFNAKRMPASVASPDSMPSRPEREAIFDKVAGLDAQIKKLDELDRDLLFMRARARPIDQLKAKYPQIAEATLKDLQAALKP